MDILSTIKHYDLEAIVCGAGPSAWDLWGLAIPSNIRMYGAGNVSRFIRLDVYAYGDLDHLENIPVPPCLTYGSPRNVNDTEGLLYYDEVWPTGRSSGGMAISLACLSYTRIGIIGFDGIGYGGEVYDPAGVPGQKLVFNYWLDRNRKLVSLMEKSIFNNLLTISTCDEDFL